MKVRKLFLAGAMMLGLVCMAESNQQQPQVPITLVKINRGGATIRPKSPDRQVITCAYDGEELHFSLVIPEGMAKLYVTDSTMITATYEFDTTPLEASIPVGNLCGRVTIELETENGNSYTGSLQ